MYARSSSLVTLAVLALALPQNPASRFTLGSTGAVSLAVSSEEARYGVTAAEAEGRPMLVVSLGATSAPGCLTLYIPGAQLPAKGRYPIRSSLGEQGVGEPAIRTFFVAGTPEHPQGWFHGESGWVTITDARAGRISGEFEIQARGFLGANPDDENQWVTVRGTFEASGDSTIGTIASLQ